MTQVIIHVRGGVLQTIIANEPIEVLRCDWDKIEFIHGEHPKWQELRASTPEEFRKELAEIKEDVDEAREDLGLDKEGD